LTPKTTDRRLIDGPAGAIEIALNVPPQALRGIALVAHPHPLQGGTLDNKVAQTLARTFFALGYASVRFNFRGAGKTAGEFDDGEGETDDALAVLAWAKEHIAHTTDQHASQTVERPADEQPHAGKDLPVVLAGFSFGAYVQTRVAAAVDYERLVLVGPAVNRFAVERVRDDSLVIHGEEDDVVPLADVFAWARPQELAVIVFPGCGHFFHGRLPHLQRAIAGLWRTP
jgi:alpha/beta superfamily hydrolase